MKCLTVCEPWATALVYDVKAIENRPVRFSVRGDLLIHAGKNLDWFTQEAVDQLHAVWPAFPAGRLFALDRLKTNLGKIVGVVHIVDCVPLAEALRRGFTAEKHFAWGPWCLLQDETKARRFKHPIPWRGQQGVYDVPADAVNGPTLGRGEKA